MLYAPACTAARNHESRIRTISVVPLSTTIPKGAFSLIIFNFLRIVSIQMTAVLVLCTACV